MAAQRSETRFAQLMARIEALEQEVALLRQDPARLREASPVQHAAAGPAAAATLTTHTSRRGVLTALGATIGAGVATLAIQRAPATAANGSAVLAGNVTTAEGRTAVTYDGPAGFNGIVLLGNDSIYDGSSAGYPAALGGWAGAGTTAGAGAVATGVYGFTDNGNGNGVVGVNQNLVAGSGSGVLGTAVSATGAGVTGINALGTAIYGSSDSISSAATAIVGILTSSAPGSFSSAVRGQNNGTAGSGIGVYGSHAGSGWGGYFTSVSGYGVNAAGGTGIGVYANGTTGISTLGETFGITARSTAGRGGLFSGFAAQMQLTPGSAATHPTSGQAGDFYVDTSARLWYCKGGTSWVELAPATIWALTAGWNLVGISQGSLAASQAVTSVLHTSGGNLSAIYRLNNGQWSQPVILHRGGSPTGTNFTLAPGVGYLLYTDKAASVSFAATGQASSAAVQPGAVTPQAGDRLNQAAPVLPIPVLP
jgi:hypothetical protein